MWRGRCLLITNPARGTAGKSWGKAPSPVPPSPGREHNRAQPTGHEGHPDLHSPGGGEEKQVQQFDGVGGLRVTCHGVLDGDRSLHVSQVTPGFGAELWLLLSPCCSQGKCSSGSQTCLLRESFGAGTAPFQPRRHTPDWAANPVFKPLVSQGLGTASAPRNQPVWVDFWQSPANAPTDPWQQEQAESQ